MLLIKIMLQHIFHFLGVVSTCITSVLPYLCVEVYGVRLLTLFYEGSSIMSGTALIASIGMTSVHTQNGLVHMSSHNNDHVHLDQIMAEWFTTKLA